MAAPSDSPFDEPVPRRYRGVWARTLLSTPTQQDDTTFVRWLQTAHRHADLRVPASARRAPGFPRAAEAAEARARRLAMQQGFAGRTRVEVIDGAERCTWHRQLDFQPPGPHPDAGRIEFDGTERMIEHGVHQTYLEVWERLPGSTGRAVVLTQISAPGAHPTPATLLVSGRYAMWVRPRATAWPEGTRTADALSDLLLRHPDRAPALLDFEISFGTLEHGYWRIERSTLEAREGTPWPCAIHRHGEHLATVQLGGVESTWRVDEWDGADDHLV